MLYHDSHCCILRSIYAIKIQKYKKAVRQILDENFNEKKREIYKIRFSGQTFKW
jgi:hypothetical protein